MVYNFQGHEIEVYDSIQNLPILRFQKLNKYTMIASEIGCDFADYQRRNEKLMSFLKKGMLAEAIQELNNRSQLVFNAYNEKSPTGYALAALIHRIDDVKYKRYAPDDLQRCLVHLENIGFDIATTLETLSEVKKNSKTNWVHTFLSTLKSKTYRKKLSSDTKD